MGIKFTCPHCKTTLKVKSELAGKRGRCPHCQQKIEIPAQSDSGGTSTVAAPAAPSAARAAAATGFTPPGGETAPVVSLQPTIAAQPVGQAFPAGQPAMAAPAGLAAGGPIDPIAEAPQLQWYVMPPGVTSQYGPAVGEEFRTWIREGRVTADTLVWRQDWPEWKPAGLVFPELQAAIPAQPGMAAPVAPVPSGYAIPTAAGALPTAAGVAPMAFPAGLAGMPMASSIPGGFPTPASSPASSGHRGPYRRRSNTGPMIVIGILVLAMIPLSFFVWKVIRQQFSDQPAATSPAKPAE